MKQFRFLMKILALILLVACIFPVFAQENEIPITSDSEIAIKLFIEARNFSENYQPTKVRAKLDDAIKEDPEFALAYLERGLNGTNYNEEIQNIQKAVEYSDKVTEGERLLIKFYDAAYNNDQKTVKGYLEKLVGLYPNDKRINTIAGNFHRYWNEEEKAIEFYKKALLIDEKFSEAISSMGFVYLNMKKYDEAEKWFKKLINIKPNIAAPYDYYAILQLNLGNYDEAIEYYNKAYDKDKDYYYPIRKIANIYSLKRDFEEARKYYRKYIDIATQLNSKFIAYDRIAHTYIYEKNKEKALESYDDYIKLGSDNDMVFYQVWGNINKGYIETCCGDPQKGIQYYTKASELIDKSDLAEERKNTLRINTMIMKSHAFIESNEIGKCNNELEKCKELVARIENSFFKDMINVISAYSDIKQDKSDEAIEKLSNVKTKHPFRIYINGLAFEQNGDIEEAEEYYNEFVNLKDGGLIVALFYDEVSKKLSE